MPDQGVTGVKIIENRQVNLHCHTALCKHAEGSVRDYCRSTVEQGLKILGFADPVLTTDGPDVMREIVPPSGIQTSAFLVRVTADELDIQAWSEERGLIDHIGILPDRRIVEKMSIPHYRWKRE